MGDDDPPVLDTPRARKRPRVHDDAAQSVFGDRSGVDEDEEAERERLLNGGRPPTPVLTPRRPSVGAKRPRPRPMAAAALAHDFEADSLLHKEAEQQQQPLPPPPPLASAPDPSPARTPRRPSPAAAAAVAGAGAGGDSEEKRAFLLVRNALVEARQRQEAREVLARIVNQFSNGLVRGGGAAGGAGGGGGGGGFGGATAYNRAFVNATVDVAVPLFEVGRDVYPQELLAVEDAFRKQGCIRNDWCPMCNRSLTAEQRREFEDLVPQYADLDPVSWAREVQALWRTKYFTPHLNRLDANVTVDPITKVKRRIQPDLEMTVFFWTCEAILHHFRDHKRFVLISTVDKVYKYLMLQSKMEASLLKRPATVDPFGQVGEPVPNGRITVERAQFQIYMTLDKAIEKADEAILIMRPGR